VLSDNALAGEIMSAIKQKITYENLNQFLPTIGHAIAKYLTKNTDILYSWAGTMPGSPPTPDSVLTYKTNNVKGDIFMYQTGVTDAVRNGVLLGKQITDGIKTFIITAAPGWAVMPGLFKASPPIVLPPAPTNDFTQLWLLWAQVIIAAYKTYINPAMLTGAHGPYLSSPGAGMKQIF